MWSHRLATGFRAASALALVAALFVSALGPPAPAATAADSPEPTARLQVFVKEVKIHDDREGFLSGEGEMRLFVGIWRCNVGTPPPCSGYVWGAPDNLPSSIEGKAGPIARAGKLFSAGTGETVTLDREVPQDGDLMWGGNTSQELGFAVYAGEHYVVQFDMDEWDGEQYNLSEYMGYVFHFVDIEEHGADPGTYTARSLREEGRSAGDYTITYEIRRTPLPDIEPVNIRVDDVPGSAEKRVCMAVLNREVGHAGPFEVALKVDGVVPPGGRYTVGVLASGTDYWACVRTVLPASGQHVLAAVVDEPRTLFEFNEANNVYEQPYQGTGSAVASTPTPSAALPDLTVSAIKVNGHVPDGKDDCTDGRNDVAVVVKNGGAANAGDFIVRLVVDGDHGDAEEQEVANGLDAGKEVQVNFGDVRLKQGQRSLAATADATTGIAESNEGNNVRTVTAGCKDDDD